MNALLIPFLAILVTTPAASGRGGYEPTPLVRLIVAPEKYATKPISTSGVAREHGDGIWVLYMDCESAAAEATLNGVSFRPDTSKKPVSENISMHYVLIHGAFQGKAGLSKLFGGSFSEIDDMTIYPVLRESVDQPDLDACDARNPR